MLKSILFALLLVAKVRHSASSHHFPRGTLHITSPESVITHLLPLEVPYATHEATYTSLEDVCEREEFSVWRTTELLCGRINATEESLSTWHLAAFSYYRNVRTYHSSSNALLVAFDIEGPRGSYGNWWRVMIKGQTATVPSESIELAGRVIDNWNGNYTVYFSLPSPGRYEMTLLLEYIACQGYPDEMRGDTSNSSAIFRYIANFTTSTWLWKEQTDTYHTSHPAPEVFRYLADTGYYNGTVWIPSAMTYACTPKRLIPRNVTRMVIAGDSTSGQLSKCAKKGTCMQILKEQHRISDSQALLGDTIQISSLILYYQERRNLQVLFDMVRKRSEPVVLLVNGGLHFVAHLPWSLQKQVVNDIVAALHNNSAIVHPHESASEQAEKNRDIYFVWRDTWSIHEYCFIPNIYWRTTTNHEASFFTDTPEKEIMKRMEHLVRMREASVHVQRSYALDKIVRNSNHVFWLPSQFLSRSAFKRVKNEDMIHHDDHVIVALWKEMLDTYDIFY